MKVFYKIILSVFNFSCNVSGERTGNKSSDVFEVWQSFCCFKSLPSGINQCILITCTSIYKEPLRKFYLYGLERSL